MRLLWLLCLCGVFAACSSPKTLRELSDDHYLKIDAAILKNVDDADRSSAMQDIQSKIQERVGRMYDELTDVRDGYVALNRDYDATNAQFDVLRDRMATARDSAAQEMIQLAMKARSVATAEDWAAIARDMGTKDVESQE
jgi:hypothetical protein